MTQYTVISDHMAGFKKGDIVNELQLKGANIKVLIEGAHLSAYTPKKSDKTKDTETEKD